ncbi:MAG: ribonuclease HII [Bacteroidia bacterium]|jgi:ribonuclease HII|nr:ribonuclease HII [Bacteroidia bacterium]
MKANSLLPYFKYPGVEAGIDEAGRGCLAGPVFAAGVILPEGFQHPLLRDSKQLSAKQRAQLRITIEQEAVAWHVASASVEEIDSINILQATFLAMHRAIEGLQTIPAFLIIDGNRFRPFPGIEHRTIVGGDNKYLSIAAASVLAKTHRDEYMLDLAQQYPAYGFQQHKGYGTLMHREAIAQLGMLEEHRKSFRLLKTL